MLLASDTLIHFICKSRCLRRKGRFNSGIEFEEVRNGNNLSFNRKDSMNREASTPKIICSALKLVALWIEQKSSTAITWPAEYLIWMSFQISFSIGCEGTSYKSYFHITISAWRCLPFSDQMKMSSRENLSWHAFRVVSNTAWPVVSGASRWRTGAKLDLLRVHDA